MKLSKGSITGITIAIITFFIASFGGFIYLRRRRHCQRRAANTATTANTSAITSSTTPSSHKHNASESHELQPRKKLPTELKNHQAPESHTPDLELGNGFGATSTETVNKKRHTVPTDSQGLKANKTPFPALDIPTTTTAKATSSNVAANGGKYATNTVTSTRSTAAARLTADFGIDLERQPHFTFSDRPSSLHQAVLEVGGKDEEIEDANRTSKDGGETKTENSNVIVKDVSQRPTGYTGAWP